MHVALVMAGGLVLLGLFVLFGWLWGASSAGMALAAKWFVPAWLLVAAAFITGSTLRIDGARPQVRMGWPMKIAQPDAQQREAIQPFNGFHRAVVPKVFSV